VIKCDIGLTISKEACYPESAIKLGSNPPEKNPGTDGDLGPAGIWPGADCTDPGPYHGAYVKRSQEYATATNLPRSYSKGNPFPLYVTAKYCGSLKEWRVTYSVYYV
jgi:hypothetical protein